VPYIIGILRGKIRPHPMTWLAWTMPTSAMALILMFNGGGYAACSIWLSVLIDITIFVLALKFRVPATITKSDIEAHAA